jgi:uncharacterized membrane protein
MAMPPAEARQTGGRTNGHPSLGSGSYSALVSGKKSRSGGRRSGFFRFFNCEDRQANLRDGGR